MTNDRLKSLVKEICEHIEDPVVRKRVVDELLAVIRETAESVAGKMESSGDLQILSACVARVASEVAQLSSVLQVGFEGVNNKLDQLLANESSGGSNQHLGKASLN